MTGVVSEETSRSRTNDLTQEEFRSFPEQKGIFRDENPIVSGIPCISLRLAPRCVVPGRDNLP